MNNLDRKIQDALKGTEEGAAIAEEPNIAEEVITVFRGRHSWITLIPLIFSFAGFALAVWAGFRFYGADVVKEQLIWGGLCLLGVLLVSFIKVWVWGEMQSNRILRELKRVELLFLQNK